MPLRIPVLLISLALCGAMAPAVAGGEGQSRADAPAGRILTVTDFSDVDASAPSTDQGAVGSLRHTIMRVAKPGDTITFLQPGVITLSHTLSIPPRLVGLTIDGSVAGGRAELRSSFKSQALLVHASNVTVAGLVIQGLTLGVAGITASTSPSGVTVRDNRFVGAGGTISVQFATGTLIQGNEFTGQRSSVNLINTLRARVKLNTFGPNGTLDDEQSEQMIVEGNTFQGGSTNLRVKDVLVRSNTFAGGRLLVFGQTRSGSRVENNTFTGMPHQSIRLQAAGSVRFTTNSVSGTAGQPIAALCMQRGEARGPRSIRLERNTLDRAGIYIECTQRDTTTIQVVRNTITGTTRSAVMVAFGGNPVMLKANTITGNRLGVTFRRGTRGVVEGGVIAANAGAGVFAAPGSHVAVRGVRFGGNEGPGIDIAPEGMTPNAARKLANNDLDWPKRLKFDKKSGKLTGITCPGCRVDIWEAEDGDEHGEGLRVLARVTAAASGKFEYPRTGSFDCPDSGKLTITATQPGKPEVTSEFSEDVECSCVVASRFAIDPAQIPTHGSSNPGITVRFPVGAVLQAGVLTDAQTDERPPDNALPSPLIWQEFQVPSSVAGIPTRDYFVSVSNPTSTLASGPMFVWRFRIPYEPPKGSRTCGAKVLFVMLPPPAE